jgi:hypothetical protein
MRASYSPSLPTPSRYHNRHCGVLLYTLLGLCVACYGGKVTAQFPGTAPFEAQQSSEVATPPDDADDQEQREEDPEDEDYPSADEAVLPVEQPPQLPDPIGMERLSKTDRAWLDTKRNRVVVDGRVSLRQGVLEMFACPRNTKEHESVVAVDAKAFVLHAALLAAGADAGGPVRFDPEYKPPHGTEINVEVLWLDKQGKRQKVRAQDWVRDVRTKRAMTLPWVFAGSGFWRDEETGKQYYQAESGDLICVSNFSTAMLDVPAESTNVNAGLFFEAFTERIPPLGTPVRVVLTPVVPAKAAAAPAADPAGETPPADEGAETN